VNTRTRQLGAQVDGSDEVDVEEMLYNAETLVLVLENHDTLGCTVEESLAYADEKLIFVSKVTKGGSAEAAGLMVGDVVTAITGVFGELQETTGIGLEQMKNLVAARRPQEPLEIRVARGTTVLSDHETALVDLCAIPDIDDKKMNECIDTIMTEDWTYLGEPLVEEGDDEPEASIDKETEDLMDSVEGLWKHEIPDPPKRNKKKLEEKERPKEQPQPWNRRSSPSGTYVRDPKTGIMKNIDA